MTIEAKEGSSAYAVAAVDAGGNESKISDPVTVMVPREEEDEAGGSGHN